MYDERGSRYDIPKWAMVEPNNLLPEGKPPKNKEEEAEAGEEGGGRGGAGGGGGFQVVV